MTKRKLLTVKLGGIHCASCVTSIERVAKDLGALKVDIDLGERKGRITFADDDILADALINAIEGVGYKATRQSLVTLDQDI